MKFLAVLLLAAMSFLTPLPVMAEIVWGSPQTFSATVNVHPCTLDHIVSGGCDGGPVDSNTKVLEFFSAIAPNQVLKVIELNFLGAQSFGLQDTGPLSVSITADGLVGTIKTAGSCFLLCSVTAFDSLLGRYSALMEPFPGGVLIMPSLVASNGNPTTDSSMSFRFVGTGIVGDQASIVQAQYDATVILGTVSPVPEPASFLLLLVGLALLAMSVAWRKWRQS